MGFCASGLNKTNVRKAKFSEYLYIETFSDQQQQEYVATVYDNDELWQDIDIIDIFKT